MRYLLQIHAMFADLVFFVAMAFVLYQTVGGVVSVSFSIFLLVWAYRAWRRGGGCVAWRPRGVRAFMKNAKESGL